MPGEHDQGPGSRVPGADPTYGFPQEVAQHLSWMRIHNYSARSVRARENLLQRFTAWCEERGITRAQDVNRAMIERYQRWLFHYRKADGRPLSFRTQYGMLVAVREFFRYLARNHLILFNPSQDVEMPRGEKRLPRHVLTRSEADLILNLPDVHDALGLRDRAILETLYSTGMRRLELIMLGVYDIDVERGIVMIRQGKGKKDRFVPIGERAVAWIEKYRTDVRPGLAIEPDPGMLFLTQQGSRFSESALTHLVHDYVKAAGIGKTGACHLFRHTMATLMLEGGADVRFVQQMLGHENLSTTQVYTHVSIRQLKDVHTRTHPTSTLFRPGKGADEDLAHTGAMDREPRAPGDELADLLAEPGDDPSPPSDPTQGDPGPAGT
jgi:integrase/recombinase XerD